MHLANAGYRIAGNPAADKTAAGNTTRQPAGIWTDNVKHYVKHYEHPISTNTSKTKIESKILHVTLHVLGFAAASAQKDEEGPVLGAAVVK